MNYNGWIVSIYDKHIEKYEEQNKNINRYNEKKEAIIFYCILIGISICLISCYFKKKYIYLGSIGLINMAFISAIYRIDIKLDDYKMHIEILRNVLEAEGLRTEKAIRKLSRKTRGIFYKFSIELIESMFVIFIIIINTLGSSYLFKCFYKKGALLMIFSVVYILCMLGVIYIVMDLFRECKMIKKKNFYQLLKILIEYDYCKEIN